MSTRENRSFAESLLTWFDHSGRHDLPWQHPRTPYRVWLAEIMLQQTQVQTVIPYYRRFVEALPDIPALAAADSDQVLQFRPVKWDYGTHRIHELPLIAGDTAGAATAINDRHQIVGISGTCDQAVGRRTATHAVLWSNGHVTDLGNIGAELWNTPGAINQRGDVVGFAGTAPEDIDGNFTHAFLKPRNGVMRDLGTLPGDISSTATGVNEWGQVVGYSNDAAGRLRAFLWQDGAMVELSSLAPEFAGDLVLATDINNFGQIVGRGKDPDTGAIIAFVATPVLRQR